jgi:hypothetical protein
MSTNFTLQNVTDNGFNTSNPITINGNVLTMQNAEAYSSIIIRSNDSGYTQLGAGVYSEDLLGGEGYTYLQSNADVGGHLVPLTFWYGTSRTMSIYEYVRILSNLTTGGNITADAGNDICVAGGYCLSDFTDYYTKSEIVTNNNTVKTWVQLNYYNKTESNATMYEITRYNLTGEPTGFSDQGILNSNLTFDGTTRQFNITGTYKIYWRGIEISKSGVDSITIPNTAGETNYIYFDSTGTLHTTIVPWENNFTNVIQVATIFYNGSVGLIGKERHGITMDSSTHYWMHATVGTRFISGMTFDYTDAWNWNITAGVLADEDNVDSNGIQNKTRVFYHVASGRYSFTDATNRMYHNISNIVQYDTLTGTTDVQNNYYVAYWIVASVDRDYPIYTIMGQREDVTIANAKLNNNWQSMSLGALDIPEYKLLYRVILRRSGTSVTISDVQDLRSVSNLPSGTYLATSHSLLTGLGSDDHTQYLLSDGTRNMTYLQVTNNISTNSVFFGEKSGIYDVLQINPKGSDGFTLGYWYNFEAVNDDWLVLQKTDGNDAQVDGGIAFMMSNTTNNRTILKLDGYGLANFTDYNIMTTNNITAGNITMPLTSIIKFGTLNCIKSNATSLFIGSGGC